MATANTVAHSTSFSKNPRQYSSNAGQTILLSAEELTLHIKGCVLNDRLSQKTIYKAFYNYAKSICDRYAKRNDDALEIVNDAFLKIFREVHRYKPAYADVVNSFTGWLKRIVIHTAIDHFRRNHKHDIVKDLPDDVIHISAGDKTILSRISYHEIIKAIQELTPGYRTILNLYIVEGLSHQEISKLVGITIGASKSNLSKARGQLKKILYQRNQIGFLPV